MPYTLQAFESPEHQRLRSIVIDGEPWFVLADVCRALDYSDKKGGYGHHAERLDDEEKRLVSRADLTEHPPFREGGAPIGSSTLLAISESGLYALILGSSKAEAKGFKKWVTSQVLPAIRKTGTYSAAPTSPGLEWKPFHDRLSLALAPVPDGFFSIFREMADLTAQLIVQGAVVDDATIPDISVGQAWAKEWAAKGYDQDFGNRSSYEHNYPAYFRQAKSNPQWPACYPEDALPTFRRWFRYAYLPEHYPQYLKRKVAKGDISAAIAQDALKAVAATMPKALR